MLHFEGIPMAVKWSTRYLGICLVIDLTEDRFAVNVRNANSKRAWRRVSEGIRAVYRRHYAN